MELKKKFIELLKKDLNFRNEVKYLLDIDNIEDEIYVINDEIHKKFINDKV